LLKKKTLPKVEKTLSKAVLKLLFFMDDLNNKEKELTNSFGH